MKKIILFTFLFLFIFTIVNAQNVNGDTLSVDGKKILKVWGTHYERGYATGYLLGSEIKEISENYFIYAFFGGNSYLYENTRTYFLDNFQIEEKYISETEGIIDGMIEADIILFSDILSRDIDANDLLLSNTIVDLAALGDLNVLLENVRDSKYNSTRFIYITKSLEVIGFHNKTSIVCAAKANMPGALYDILHEFAIRNIDLAKIESRPRKSVLGEYLFYIDFYGNIDNPEIKQALEVIKYKTDMLRILGSYYSKKR